MHSGFEPARPRSEEFPVSVGKLLREARERKGLSRKALGDVVEINPNSIAKYEQAGETGGQYPPLDKLGRICIQLDLSPIDVVAEAMSTEGLDPAPLYIEDQSAIQPGLEKASRLLTEATAILQRHGIGVDLNKSEFVDIESFIEDGEDASLIPGEAELQALIHAVGHRGIDGRAIPRIVSSVWEFYKGLEYSELFDLATILEDLTDLDVYPSPDQMEDTSKAEREKACDNLAARVIVHGLYPAYYAALTLEGLEAAARALPPDTRGILSTPPVDTSGLLEGPEKAASRLRVELPFFLVQAASSGQALNFFDEEAYPLDEEALARFEGDDDLTSEEEPETEDDEEETFP